MPDIGFLDLPVEIQIKIIQMAIPPMVLPEHITTTGSVVSNERAATNGIMATCHKFRSLLLKARPLVGQNPYTGQLFTFDPERDTLLVKGMNLPAFLSCTQKPNHHTIRRLMTFSKFPVLPPEQDYSGRVSEHHGGWLLRTVPTWATNDSDYGSIYNWYWRIIPFETSLPVARDVGSLQEMIVVVQNAPGWHIPSFQQYGPEPEPQRTDPVLGNLNHPVHHVGIRWTHPETDHSSYRVPMIGLHGYSKTSRRRRNQEYAMGGQWAGFRYDINTQEVEFRPLTWDEVEHIVHRQQQPQHGRRLPDDQDPEFVARI
ncbi:uncharacterized protein BKA55DRAFT_704401 [Fusarium redolens]|uniref:2EXR domain-containing protein n=1 Tax=Fusarium redolens TaxID=48865 RepID=A0A9P9K958_FUSRE|nr:uncharacterized protein BKA55DRAFT_704401 [Fusarium redolens]KAH7244484.1 hypothetical protein BKA55DRAFT_704401 [Fusarium redolens]